MSINKQAFPGDKVILPDLKNPLSVQPEPEKALERLSSKLPVALLPVRLETHFEASARGPELLIRIYPDDIHVDTHEPGLTGDEAALGQQFWEQTWRAGNDEARQKAAWQLLAGRFGPQRAAWIAHTLKPLNSASRPITPLPAEAALPIKPEFPAVPRRAESWTQAPHTRLLPDRWVALGYRAGTRVFAAWGNPVPDILQVGPAPFSPASGPLAGKPTADAGMAWMLDFEEAVKVGMGLRVKLTPEQAQGLERLLVLGVKTSLASQPAARRLAEAFEAHHYTRGLSFVPPGTPTNNTEQAPAGYSSADPGFARSFQVARQAALFQPGDGLSGDRASKALGINAEVFNLVGGADGKDQMDSRHMNTVLWAATWGYFLEQMMAETFSDEAVNRGRRHFIEFVRAAGPLPALRAGNQPYGLLPVTALERWTALEGTVGDAELVGFLRLLRPVWRRALGQVPRVGGSSDPDQDLIQVLGMGANSSSYFARSVVGRQYITNLGSFMGLDLDDLWWNRQESEAQAILKTLKLSWKPRLARSVFAADALALDGPPVQAEILNDSDLLNPDYLTWLAQSSYQDIRDEKFGTMTKPKSLLYLLLRHSALLEYGTAAFRLQFRRKMVSRADRLESEMVDLLPNQVTPTVWRQLKKLVPGLTGKETTGAYLQRLKTFSDPDVVDWGEFRASLTYLAKRPAAKLEQLMAGTLDLCSHRLDAWITSFATKRLNWLRQQNPAGIYLGGYGWVEDLKPGPARHPVTPPPGEEGSPLSASESKAGFVHAPSLAQATTAAILHSGRLSHSRTGQADLLSVDLSSERVRLALWLLDGVRQGQPLGALLGYRFERGLHENHPGLNLDRFIRPFRELAPLALRQTETTSQPQESVVANIVVDGLTLQQLRGSKGIPFGQRGLPSINTPEFKALTAELDSLDDAIDALADTTLAESVYQLVQGNPLRAAATLDALGRGDVAPPELEVVRTPRTGRVLSHRLAAIFNGEGTILASWPTNRYQARAQAEASLNAWVGRLLGDPTRVRCRAEIFDQKGALLTPPGSLEVKLSELELSPLDLLYNTEIKQPADHSELEQRLVYYLLRKYPQQLKVQFNFERDQGWSPEIMSFDECLEVVRSVRALLATARPLEARDLVLPEETTPTGLDNPELSNRANVARTRLQEVQSSLQNLLSLESANLELVRDRLFALAHLGIPGAVPTSAIGDEPEARDRLFEQARLAAKEASQRLERLAELANAQSTTASPEEICKFEMKRLGEIFGTAFKVLPRFQPANGPQLTEAFAAKDLAGEDSLAPLMWFQRVSFVREGAARLNTALMYAGALDSSFSPGLKVGQLPFRPGERWIGLPGQAVLPANRLSLVIHAPEELNLSQSIAGLLIDEWNEVVPNERETTGVAFQFDEPEARASQTILLAVTPDNQPTWSLDTLEAILSDTLDLAKIRAVDPDALGEVGHFLPALYFASNAADETISTDFSRAVAEEGV